MPFPLQSLIKKKLLMLHACQANNPNHDVDLSEQQQTHMTEYDTHTCLPKDNVSLGEYSNNQLIEELRKRMK